MSYPRLESTYRCWQGDAQNSAHRLAIFFHWKLMQEGFLCAGSGGTSKTELLPDAWNSQSDLISLDYVDNCTPPTEVALEVKMEGTQTANCSLTRGKDTSSVRLDLEEHIDPAKTDTIDVYKNKEGLVAALDKLLSYVRPKQASTERPQSTSGPPPPPYSRDPLREGPRPGPDAGPPGWGGVGPPPIGGADLDPLGRGLGGGMLMDPRGGGGMGFGPVRPRWDPVGPRDPFAGPPMFGPRGGGMGGPPGGFGGPGMGGGLGGPGMGGFGGRRNFGDAMGPPGWDDMFM